MKRADRHHAIVNTLRARRTPLSVRQLAERFEVSSRTIERDLAALQDAGIPIYAEPGRSGGYVISDTWTLPPLNLSEGEALAALAGLTVLERSPLQPSARLAASKILSILRPETRAAITSLVREYRVLLTSPEIDAHVSRTVHDALVTRRVLQIDYVDATGNITRRDIEPAGILFADGQWYVSAWCRLRNSVRGFRVDRIRSASLTEEEISLRPHEDLDADLQRWPFERAPLWNDLADDGVTGSLDPESSR